MNTELLAKFEEIVRQYQKDIVNFHYRLVGNRFEAEDLAQQTFLKAYNKFDSLKEQEKVKSWLYSIARNVTIDFFRKNKNRAVPLDDLIMDNYARTTAVDYRNEVLAKELSQEIRKCVAKLPAEDQRIVKLLYFEGFSYKEIGNMMNINQNTLKSRLHRARKLIASAIQENPLLKDIVPAYA
ncbi:MAG TPA: sigma-70 family RNA polymerase sigma factor [Patescibacteria group bacterium]|nr:sigma-70 family RNA polymerase sigma factor [Patescibacteria group bacterium]